jgi:hypothetical protein
MRVQYRISGVDEKSDIGRKTSHTNNCCDVAYERKVCLFAEWVDGWMEARKSWVPKEERGKRRRRPSLPSANPRDAHLKFYFPVCDPH